MVGKCEKRSTALGHYWSSAAKRMDLRECLRNQALTLFKEAGVGGSQEAGFEQAFASLAYSYLKDKSPRLLDYIVGFQLVERNEDNTKAMGVFGFKVGDQWLYGPVFFLNGDLKGHELLYIKKQDAFVPQKENWVNHLISRKPHLLGESSPRDTQQLGGVPPDIYQLTHPPTSSKYGGDAYRPDVQEWAVPFLKFIGAAANHSDKVFTKQAALNKKLDLHTFLGEDFSLLQGAYELTQRYPLIKVGIEKFYGKGFFLKMAGTFKRAASSLIKSSKSCSGQTPPSTLKKLRRGGSLIPDQAMPEHPLKSGSLRIITHDPWEMSTKSAAKKIDMEAPGGLVEHKDQPTLKEQEKLLRDGVVVRDTREEHEKSVVYNTQVRLELTNPSETGIYSLLEKPGKFDDMLVVMHPHTNRRREMWATVVRLSDPRNWLNIHTSNLWAQASPGPERPAFNKWFEGLEGTKDLKKGAYYLAIGPNGAGTTPFEVRAAHEGGAYQVNFQDHAEYRKSRPTWTKELTHDHDYGDYVSSYDAKLFFNEREGSSLRAVGGELSVPNNFKVLKLKGPPPPPKKDRDGLIPCCSFLGEETGEETGSEKRPIQPGNLLDIQLFIHEKTAQLKVMASAGEVWIKSQGVEERMTKKAALVSLVRDHGCSEEDARLILKEVTTKGPATFRIKYADSFGPNSNSMLQGGPNAPAFPQPLMGAERVGYNSYPAMYPQEELNQVHDMSSQKTDPTIYDPFYQPDQQAMQMAQESAASGQKEVFDTAMISGMLKSVRQASLVDRYIGPLMMALDKLGRIYFMFLWHQEEFEDRYGKQDLPELEDGLRNAFESLGDIVLFLKEKQVGGGMDEINSMTSHGKGEPDIEEVARN